MNIIINLLMQNSEKHFRLELFRINTLHQFTFGQSRKFSGKTCTYNDCQLQSFLLLNPPLEEEILPNVQTVFCE